MTVAEMIEKLSKLEPSLPVYILANNIGKHIDPRKPGGNIAVIRSRGRDEHECLLLFPENENVGA